MKDFVERREWEQFHSPKNLSMALAVECAELMEHFQWLTEDQSRQVRGRKRKDVESELADIQIYLLSLARVLGVDLLRACDRKLVRNARKYPISKARGNAKKYTELKRKAPPKRVREPGGL